MVEPDTIFVRADIALSSAEDGKTSIMNIEQGTYFDLEEPGTTIWQLLEKPISFTQLCHGVAEQFDAPANVIEQDTASFLHELEGCGLVTTQPVR